MKNICFYFQVHQPFRLRTYRFFDIGKNHHYFDEQANSSILAKVAAKCYLPANNTLLELIRQYGSRFKVSFSISGTALDQFERYAPEVMASFQELAATGSVEILSETYSHSLSALVSPEEFKKQVAAHAAKVQSLFNQKPQVFRNTELIYSDKIGEMVQEMGFKTMLTEGASHVLGWKSPNFLYCSAVNPKLRLLLKNFRLSDDIAFRFGHPTSDGKALTAEKFVSWLNAIPNEEEIVNLFMDYETFGEHQWAESGIFNFLKALPHHVFSSSQYGFVTPGEASNMMQPIATISMPEPVSWADEERNLSAWLGNDLQDNAFESLYRLESKIKECRDADIHRDWLYLQTSDHFYYMCTKYFADGDVHKYFNPYNSPYQAYINYMNVLGDFEKRIEAHLKQAGEKSGKAVAS
jgi:alpha-amylase